MRFQRLELNNFRQFDSPLVIDAFDPAFNLICGDNEEGKSTLLLAIQAALFERYDRGAGERLRPYNAAVSPEIKLDFSLAGCDYQLHKIFSKRNDKTALLSSSRGERWEGPQAEEHLQQLLGFSLPARGESKAELQGVSGLLWVSQTKAFEPINQTPETRSRLQATLDQEIDQLLGGETGQQLYLSISQQLEQYLGRSGKPIGEFKKLIDQESALDQKLATINGQLAEYDGMIDQLQRLQERQADYQSQQTLEKTEQQLIQARTATEQIETMRKRLEASSTALDLAQARLRIPESQWLARQNRQQEIADRSEEISLLEQQLQQLEQQYTPDSERFTALESELTGLSLRQDELRKQIEKQHSAISTWRLQQHYQVLSGNRKHAQTALSRCDEIRQHLNAHTIDQSQIDRLRQLQSQISRIEQAIELAGTLIQYQINPGSVIQINQQPLDGSGELSVTRETEIGLPEIGTLTIRPRGTDLESLSTELAQHQTEQQTLLAALGVTSWEQAQTAWQSQQNLQLELKGQQATLATLIPEGSERLDAEIQRLERQLAGTEIPAQEPSDKKVVDLNRELEEITALHRTRTQEMQRLNQADELRKSDILAHKARVTAGRENLTVLENRLASERQDASDQTLGNALSEARAAVEHHRLEQEQAATRLNAAKPEDIELQRDRAEINYNSLLQDLDQLSGNIAALRNQLAGMGHSGLAEQKDELAAKLEQLRAILAQESRQAEALKLLHSVLEESLKSAKSLMAEPVIRKMQPYLDILIPGSHPLIDDDMGLQGIARAGVDEQFQHLSIGTREQIAIIIRLAYADLLHESGQPVCLFLDDALVYSDDQRRTLMKQILFKASRNYQINFLTCHEAAYRDAGAQIIRLSDCRTST